MAKKIKVLIVDDSALVRQVLTSILESSDKIEVVGTASDAMFAREKIKRFNPDVITLDVEMPKMDGLTFLQNIMRLRPMPVVMISSMTEEGADTTLDALEIGAIDYIAKPKTDMQKGLEEYADTIISKVVMAASARPREYKHKRSVLKVCANNTADEIIRKKPVNSSFKVTQKIIAIGASTGGTEAIKEILESLPAEAPAIVISQHIPAYFSRSFAERINKVSDLNVCQPYDGMKIMPGCVYISPGDKHLIIKPGGSDYICTLNDGPPVNRHKPSVDVMFRSLSQSAGPNAMGILLTGMGSDGAQGLLEMNQQGAYTVCQDEDTSVVWGMPGAASKLGAADKELALGKISAEIMRFSIR